MSSLANGSTSSELGPCFVRLAAGRRGADHTDCKLPATFTRWGRSIRRSAGSVVLLNQSRIHSIPSFTVMTSRRYPSHQSPAVMVRSAISVRAAICPYATATNATCSISIQIWCFYHLPCDIVTEHPITGNCHLMHAGRIARDPDQCSQHSSLS